MCLLVIIIFITFSFSYVLNVLNNKHIIVQVEECLVSVEELLDADEVFCTGTAVVISPVGSITYLGKR